MSNGYGSSKRGGDGYGNFGRSTDDYDPYGDSNYRGERYNAQAAAPQSLRNMPSRPRVQETSAERQIAQVLDHIKSEWPSMCREDCVPVQLALQLLDNSSVGRAHDYRKFQTTHKYLQESLKNIVHEHHQGFNSSIGTFHKIQSSIQVSQKRVRALKESLAQAKTSLCATDPGLKILSEESKEYDELLQTLNELDDLRAVPDQLEARISEKRFLTAVDVLQTALRKLRKPELDNIGALSDLRSYLANQETVLMDILVEELHEHLYLKSPYCQQRWSSLAKNRGGLNESNHNGANPPVTPFYLILDSMDFERPVLEDPMKNPEADTFYYVTLLVEALNKLGRLQNAVETLKQRLPVELFGVVNETINEVEQRHPTSFRSAVGKLDGVQIYSARELQMRADVIYDLLWTLYGKFEAIGEGQRVFHESIKALIRREGSGNNIALLGSFKELWHLYQNEIRSLLHNYVTTDADVYQFDSPTPGAGAGGKDGMREHLFKFSETDTKSTEVTAEFDALESIIQATVPGLTSGSRKQGSENKRNRSTADELGSRRSAGYGVNRQAQGSYKSLVEPSVFNMSLLLPPTLIFLQRLKTIVPPGSDLATSTLTTFLDNFLVNVFQPQLDETLGKLCDAVFGEADSFLQDPDWNQCSQRPIFKGATAFFQVVTAFCRMLGTIPPDQALSSLIVTQMMRYYDRCFSWFQSLVTKRHDQPADSTNLRASARFSVQSSEVNEVAQKLWASEELDSALMRREVQLLIQKTNSQRLEANDVIQDRDTISALCLLYTSMRWLAAKIQSLKTFDTIVSSFEELAATALLTLHMEVRCRIIYSLRNTLSPDSAPYVLEQDVREPDPQIISLNQELVLLDETIVEFLREKEIVFIRTGLGILINNFLVQNARLASPMNDKGCHRMQLNILVLQQNLKNIEDGVDLAKATSYFQLFERGPEAIVEKAREYKDRHGMGTLAIDLNSFSYDELRALVELCYSEQLANPERGITAAARRQMDNKFAKLSEFKWE
ncbi:hypothetical protein MKX07_001443 [Trichoderma sp. CBMAI-0711]|nr:hypothetical protein MKX07_001443 [Trichoderma sp. CBMAI-0711]